MSEAIAELRKIIPQSTKMNQALVMSAAVAYIQHMQTRVDVLERENEELKSNSRSDQTPISHASSHEQLGNSNSSVLETDSEPDSLPDSPHSHRSTPSSPLSAPSSRGSSPPHRFTAVSEPQVSELFATDAVDWPSEFYM